MYDRQLSLTETTTSIFVVSTTHIINLYDRFAIHILPHQSMHDYLIDMQTICDIFARSGHPFEEMQQVSIILNEDKGKFDNVVVVIHGSWNPYDIASINYVLLCVEVIYRNQLFDNPVTVNVLFPIIIIYNLFYIMMELVPLHLLSSPIYDFKDSRSYH